MAHSVKHRWIDVLLLGRRLFVPVLLAGMSLSPAQAQQFGQPRPTPANPAESSAFSAAIAIPDPGARISAIQQFMVQYPNSPMRQAAIAQLMMAKRAVGDTPATPAGSRMNQQMQPQAMQPMSQPQPQPNTAAAAPAEAPASSPLGPPRDSLLQHPAKPAQVTTVPGSLTIKADNSSLSDILSQISKSTGMHVEGLERDDRIFGSYGPGDPHEVLLSLLQGSGYNVLMIGDNQGTPRALTLTQRSSSGSAAPTGTTASNDRQDDDNDVDQEPAQPQPQEPPPAVQPQGNETPNLRNPADVQQEMFRLRQQQQQQQQQPQ
jgi:hypothetical protein